MDQQALRAQYSKLYRFSTLSDGLQTLDIFANYLYKTILNYQPDQGTDSSERDAKIVNQMVLMKALHTKQLLTGVELNAYGGGGLNRTIDPTLVAALLRNLYETVSAFNLIYRTAKAGDERLVIYRLWVIAGLNYRQRFNTSDTTEENKKKAEEEKEMIKDLTDEIKNTALYKELDEKDKGKFDTLIKDKEFKIKFDAGKIRFLSWQDLSKILGDKYGMWDNFYTYLSLNSHPSNVSVFQFAEMFKPGSNDFIEISIGLLRNFLGLLGCFVADYIYLFPQVKNTFESLPLIEQLVINGMNRLIRGDEYSINDSAKHLG